MTTSSFHGWDPFASNLILRKAFGLVGKAGITRSDVHGLAEELSYDLYQRARKFDPRRGSWEAFATHVLNNHCADLLRYHRTARRMPECKIQQLSAIPSNKVEDAVFFPERAPYSHTKESDLRMDNERVMSSLPSKLRAVCSRLLEGASREEIANHYGVTRSTVARWVKKIRRRYEVAGMRDYLT